jgi:dihydroneopterin aldolase
MTCLVCLENIEFFAYHGYYPAEQMLGNRYSVDVQIETDFLQAAKEDALAQTIHYGEVYAMIQEQMAISAKLLEHLAYRIVAKIFEKYEKAYHIEITVRKHNPPIGAVCGASKIVLKLSRENYFKNFAS